MHIYDICVIIHTCTYMSCMYVCMSCISTTLHVYQIDRVFLFITY